MDLLAAEDADRLGWEGMEACQALELKVSIDIEAYVGPHARSLRSRWQEAFAEVGLTCEFRPDFDPATWTAGDLVAKLQVLPNGFPEAGLYGDSPFTALCRMEISAWPAPSIQWLAKFPRAMHAQLKADAKSLFEEKLAKCSPPLRPKLKKATSCFLFQTNVPCPPPDWRFLITAAATLAKGTGGLLYVPMQGVFYADDEAIVLAQTEAQLSMKQKAVRRKAGQGWKVRNFQSWPVALKNTEPEFADG